MHQTVTSYGQERENLFPEGGAPEATLERVPNDTSGACSCPDPLAQRLWKATVDCRFMYEARGLFVEAAREIEDLKSWRAIAARRNVVLGEMGQEITALRLELAAKEALLAKATELLL